LNHNEAVEVLQTISELFPDRFELTKKKANILIPQLKKMDYQGVMDNLSSYVVEKPFPPTIAEIASYPAEKNDHLEKVEKWKQEAQQVSPETKRKFEQQFQKLAKEISHDSKS